MKRIIIIVLLLINGFAWSQEYKFGNISKANLEEKVYPLDSTANAAVLHTERTTKFLLYSGRGFSIVETYFKRVKIYTKNGINQATVKIPYYKSSNGEEEVRYLKAVSYNLENGKIVDSKLDKSKIFTEKVNDNYYQKKFTFANVKEGTIIEWQYTFETPFINDLDEVILQEDIPIKHLKVQMDIPEFFIYHAKLKGSLPVKFQENSNTIIKVNIPALKNESYAGNINNYRSGIIYELATVHYENSEDIDYSTDWNAVTKAVFHSLNFGKQLHKTNYFKDDLKQLNLTDFSEIEKVNKIFSYIKQKIKWNKKNRFYTKKGVSKAYKEGVGNSAEINLSLIAMLRAAGLKANPVLLSTINHGIPLYPTERGFNYVIAHVATEQGDLLLDATDYYSLANVLPKRGLNFQGRLIQENGGSKWIELFPNQHSTKKTTITASFDGSKIKGISRKEMDNYFLYNYRKKYGALSKDAFLSKLSDNESAIEVLNVRHSFLNDLDKNAIELMQFETEHYIERAGNKIFISPLLQLTVNKNPFKSSKREFPIINHK